MSKLGDRLLAAKRLKREDVTALVPEWADLLGGERVYVRELTGAERDDYEVSRVRLGFDDAGKVQRVVNHRNLRARLVSMALVDEAGERLFPDAERLGATESGDLLDRLFEKAEEVSGLAKRVPIKNGPGTDSSPDSAGNTVDSEAKFSPPATAAN